MKFFKKNDIIIVLAICLVGIALTITYNLIFSKEPAKAEIYYKSNLVKTIELNKGVEKSFSVSQNKDVVFHLYSDGSICFEKSDCPDKICVKSGKLRIVGQSAACLPNELFLKIVSENQNSNDDIDMIIGR